jgi:hypothetical protein
MTSAEHRPAHAAAQADAPTATAAVAVRDEDRAHAFTTLRHGLAQGKVSHHTFERRLEAVITASEAKEITAVLSDLPFRERRGRVVRTVGRVAAFQQRVRHAWQAERHPQLVLPTPGRYPMSIGRAPGSVLRISDATVSRYHAQLHNIGGYWTLRDIGSANGTWVNGSRVVGAVPVASGDLVRFGSVTYRIAAL